MISYVYLNRCFVPENEAAIPITDRGFLFGDGLFTTLRVSEGVVEFAEEHVKGLRDQCMFLGLELPTIDFDILNQLVNKNQAMNGVWRMKIIVTGGNDADLFLNPRSIGTFLITLKPYQPQQGQEYKLVDYPQPISKPSAKIKSLSYLDRLQVKQYALEKGAHDAIVRTSEGYVTETAFSNLFWCVQDKFMTPSRELDLYAGVTLQVMKECALEMGLSVHEVKLKDVPQDAHVYTCNAMSRLVPVSLLGDRPHSRNPDLEDAFIKAYLKRCK